MFSNSTPESFGPQPPNPAKSKTSNSHVLGSQLVGAPTPGSLPPGTDSLDSHKRSETRVDHCGQSWFEVWLPTDALEAFDEWFDESLESLEREHADWSTPNSNRRRR